MQVLKLKPTSVSWYIRKKVDYLRYIVSDSGITVDPKKTFAIDNFLTPTDLKSLRLFLGLTSYYRRFVPNYSVMAQPLYKLTRKDMPYQWILECAEAFTQLKKALMQAPVGITLF